MPETITPHTPGPWIYSPERHTHDSLIHEDKPVDQYGYYGPDSGGVVGSSEWTWLKDEDARLIAAAPDLLEAADHIDRTATDIADDMVVISGSAYRLMRAAIAKATGDPDAQ